MLTVNGVDKDIFLSSNSISMVPCISAEWNQNIFNSPYVTVAGDGTKKTITKTGGPTLTEETESNKHPNFNTFSYDMDGSDTISYTCTGLSGKAYKIITYITTDSLSPILVNTYAAGGSRQFGSNNVEVISAGWTKVETVIGGTNDTISSFTFNITPNKLSSADSYGHLYLTQPEVYETTYFDYQRGAIWNTEAVFTGFRPGESYVTSGNSLINFPSEYRKINTSNLLKGNNNFYMPVSPLFSSPSFFMTSTSAPVYKHSLFSSLSNYKYFISDTNSSTSISGIYADTVLTNKVVIKFNTYLSIPTVNVSLTLSDNSVINSGSVTPDNTGTLILYLNSGTLNTTKWSTMPTIDSNGAITNYIDVKKITVQLVGTPTPSTYFNTSNSYVSSDKNRMHVVEISPRLELDLTDYVISVSSNKSLDGKETYMPISSVVTDDASIVFSGIPLGDINSPIPVFSNVSNYSNTKLKGLLRKNVKFYINYLLKDYVSYSTNANISVNKIIPGGVWYSDIWQQQDINTIDIQCFDITRYLQTTPSSDYVSTYRDAFEVIANVLDLAGFTDYDIDSLYSVCKDNNTPINMNYYFCNSKDTTLMEALNQIFLPYQIAAYIDNYGVMKFLSLSSIMQKTNTSEDFILGDDDVVQGGYSITNKTKPGKISLRYTTPRIKQSLSLQNVSNIDIKNGPGYVYTTSNDVVWEQQTTDAVGLNFLSSSMNNTQNYFNLNASDLLDIFHTFDLNNNGYVAVEDEIMSFAYKEYTISNTNSSATVTVSVKNHLELAEAVNRFIQENKIGLVQNYGAITNVTHSTSGGLGYNTYTISSSGHLTSVNKGDYISVSGMNPDQLNVSAQVVSTSGHTFTVRSDINKPFVSGGEVTKGFDYDVVIAPTGKITNVQRGMFGTNVSAHNVISTLTSKNLSSGIVNSGFSNTSTGFSVDSSNKSITINPYSTGRNVVYPTSNVDESYNTFSVKFNFDTSANLASAGLFMGLNTSNPNGATFLELVRYNVSTNSIPNFKYILVLSQEGYAPTAYADVTSVAQGIVNNFQKLYYKNNSASKADGSDAYILYTHPAETFHLRFTAIPYTNSVDGEGSSAYPSGYVMGVFLNNFEITNWQQYIDNQWTTTDLNTLTGLRKKVRLNWSTSPGLKFGAVADSAPIIIYPTDPDITYPTSNYSSGSSFVYIREIYATQKVLKERSVNYYFQDREFLNGMIQGERLFSDYKEYIMQTQPTAIGINTYDVQYTNGAAVSVDVLPAEYSLLYFPGNTLLEQQFIQHQLVDEYSVSYSTPLNTGFRAKFALANNSPHMVYLKKDSDELVQSVVNFNLWTHEIIVPSDPEIVEHITDAGNLLETMQIDTPFIQSKSSALKLLKLVEHSLDNFSKDVSITIFGNPIIEVGDIVKFTYPLAGINQQKYLVHSVQNSFNEGFTTKLILNQLNKGINI